MPHKICGPSKQSGFVLITGIIFLIVIAIAAISSMEISNLDYKMATNSAFKDHSFQASETGRITSGDAINQFTYERSWDNTLLHNAIVFEETYNPLAQNNDTENLFNGDTLHKDMTFAVSKSDDIAEINADIYIMRAPGVASLAGMGTQQFSGYEGAGKGIATGGSAIYFELRSRGMGNGGAETITASEYRTFIQ